MESKVILSLDKRRQLNNLTYAISLKIYHHNSKSYINLKEYALDDFWDQKNGRLLKGAKAFPSLSWVNEKINGKFIDASRIIKSLEETGTLHQLSHADLRQRILNKSPQASFMAYLDNMIAEFTANGNDGQASIHNALRVFIRKYAGSDDFKFEQINYRLLKKIEGKYSPRIPGNKNGLAVQLRAIRAIWNRAIKEGIVKSEFYPFKDYTIKTSKTHKTAISQDDLRALNDLVLPKDTHAWHGKNMFFFSFYTRGMNFSDIAKLKVKNIRDGRVSYQRSKTKRSISIKLTDNINNILNLYLNNKNPDAYIFPVISDAHIASKQMHAWHGVINHALKRWAKRLNIDSSLSFNTARHSWATIGKNMNIPIAVLSEGLGHADIGTTQIYLDSFTNDIVDNANELISF